MAKEKQEQMRREKLTASRMASLLTCPRKHYYAYELGLKKVVASDALRFGTAWHGAMEARWRGAASFAEALAASAGEAQELDELQLSTLAGLLAGYYATHGEHDSLVKELNPEVEFRHPLKGSRTFDAAGKIDGLGVLHDGRLALVEHKTTSSDVGAGSEYWSRLRFNQQVYQYVVAARALGWDVAVVLYDVTRKPMIRQKKDETAEQFGLRLADDARTRPEFYYARREVLILDGDVEEFLVQRLALGRAILDHRGDERLVSKRAQAWPRNCSDMVCRWCEYEPFCLQNVTVDEANPPAGFRIGAAHAELSAAV